MATGRGHLELQTFGKSGSELPDIGIAFRLRSHTITIGVGQMQFTQRRQLPKNDGVVHVRGATGQRQAAILVDGKIAQ